MSELDQQREKASRELFTAIRVLDTAHAKWMDTSFWAPEFEAVKMAKDKAVLEYQLAYERHGALVRRVARAALVDAGLLVS